MAAPTKSPALVRRSGQDRAPAKPPHYLSVQFKEWYHADTVCYQGEVKGRATRQLTAKIEGGVTSYYHQDSLSVRLMTNSSGTKIAEQGHFPYGELWYPDSGAVTKWGFTSYERDGETGNDYAMARSYVNRLGRFNSADPMGGDVSDPQSLNRYAYVQNDPVNKVDPSGLCGSAFSDPGCCDPSDPFSSCGCDNDPFSCVDPCLFFCSPPGEGGGGGGNPPPPPNVTPAAPPGPPQPLGDPSDDAYGDWSETLPGGVQPFPPPFGGIHFPSLPNPCTYTSGNCGGVIYGFTDGGSWSSGRWRDWLDWLRNVAWLGTAFIPIPATGGTVAVTVSAAHIPQGNVSCLGVGVALQTPSGKVVSGGPLTTGNLKNAKNILSGWSWSFGGQATPGRGVQTITNKSGSLGGPTAATGTGASAGGGGMACTGGGQ